MTKIVDEGLRSKRFETWPHDDAGFWTRASATALARARANLADFPPGSYPAPSSRGLRYPPIANREWTSSFWSGILWLSYELSGESQFREAALLHVPDFRKRLDERIAVSRRHQHVIRDIAR